MELKLKNPLAFFDLETTGINISQDRIVEISILKVSSNGHEEIRTDKINPGIPIISYTCYLYNYTSIRMLHPPGAGFPAFLILHRLILL